MALPILATVGKAARAAFPLIEGAVSRGLSATATNDLIRATMGQGIRRQTLLDIMRAVKGIESASSQLKFMNPNSLVNVARLAPAVTKMRHRYAFMVEVRGFLETGERKSVFVNVVTDNNALTRQDIEDIAVGVVESNLNEYEIEVEDAVIQKGWRAAGGGSLN